MKRKDFLSLISFGFTGSFFLSARDKRSAKLVTDCDDPITPSVPEGPFYKDEKMNRFDITETKKGTPVEYIFRVEDEHCKPIQGAIVDIWQCDNEGVYSDFKQENTENKTWLRGYQVTDKNGMCGSSQSFRAGMKEELHTCMEKCMLKTELF